MGKGKLLKFRELDTFSHVIQAPYRSMQDSDFPLKGKWAGLFFKNKNPLILELGCGKGEYTVQLARKYPDKNFLGVDIKGARIWKGAKESLENELKNAGFLRTNIEIIERFFAPKEIKEIWLTFPDPQMKKVNRRLTSAAFIARYKKIMADDGIIHLKTDSNFLFRYTLALAEKNNFKIIVKTDDLYHSGFVNEIPDIRTFYENQWLSRGFAIKYLSFRIHSDEPFTEPDVKIEKDGYRSFGRGTGLIQQNGRLF